MADVDAENIRNEAECNDLTSQIEEERARRISIGAPLNERNFQQLPVVAYNATRQVVKAEVIRSEEEERQRRISQDMKIDVLNELERQNQIAKVIDQVEEERERAIESSKDLPLGPDDPLKDAVLENVRSQFSHSQTLKLEEIAREEKILRDLYDACISETIRVVNRKAADSEADNERNLRILMGLFHKSADKASEIARAMAVNRAVDEEKAELIRANMDNMKQHRESCALTELLDAIQRFYNAKKVDKDCDDEQARKIQAEFKDQAMTELQRVVARDVATKLFKAEAAEAAHKHILKEVLSDIERQGTIREVIESVEQERAERIAAAPQFDEKSACAISEVLESIERFKNMNEAASLADFEKVRRTVAGAKENVLYELERAVAWKNTKELIEDEVARVKHTRILQQIVEQLERRQHAIDNTVGFETRKKEAVSEFSMKTAEDFQRSNELLTDIERRGNQRYADLEAEKERCRRMVMEMNFYVQDELRRHVAQTEADKAADIEKAERVTEMKARAVFEELGKKRRRKEAIEAEERERVERKKQMEAQIRLRRSNFLVQELLAEVELRHRQMVVAAECEEERESRIFREKLSGVFSDLLRHLNQRRALSLMDDERIRRVVLEKNEAVLSELRRYHDALQANAACDIEQKERIKSQNADRLPANNLPGFFELLEDIERSFNKRLADEMAENERTERVYREKLSDALSELERKCALKDISLAVEVERARRVAFRAFEAVKIEMERRMNCAAVDKAVDAEKMRRVKDLVNPMPMKTEVLEELLRQASSVETERLEEEERSRHQIALNLGEVHSELLISANVRFVKEAIRQEEAHISHQMSISRLNEELLRKNAGKVSKELCEAERAERVQNSVGRAIMFEKASNSFRSEIPEKAKEMHVVLEDKARAAGDLKIARDQLESIVKKKKNKYEESKTSTDEIDTSFLTSEEQRRRIALDKEAELMGELERHKAQVKATFEAEMERERRIAEDMELQRKSASERFFAQGLVRAMTEIERGERMFLSKKSVKPIPTPSHLKAMEEYEAAHQGFLFVDDSCASSSCSISDRAENLSPDTQFVDQGPASQFAFLCEQQRRNLADIYSELLLDMERQQNQRDADRMVDLETIERKYMSEYEAEAEKLERATASKIVDMYADMEQELRVLLQEKRKINV